MRNRQDYGRRFSSSLRCDKQQGIRIQKTEVRSQKESDAARVAQALAPRVAQVNLIFFDWAEGEYLILNSEFWLLNTQGSCHYQKPYALLQAAICWQLSPKRY